MFDALLFHLSVHFYFVYFSFTHHRPQRSWGKVIFSEACVKNSLNGGEGGRYPLAGAPPWVGTPPLACTPPGQVHPPAGTPPQQVHPSGRYTPHQVHPPSRYTPRGGTPPAWSMSGWYASYWNEFLFYYNLLCSSTFPKT